ncbi:spermatogenesis associated 6-like protein [Tiliqua scincoides]|uniref:spermatogenesis associated 6-like protein n=1 Tax=Tiliqua scincoides TaxID=71010 RepID=UPI003461B70C
MPLKVVVELQIHAVTCPGVYLMEKNDVYLHVSILGQCKETDCRPPIFPLLFREKLWFEKVFEKATDPVAVVELLEKNVTKFQLSELISSEEEDIAFYEENTRDFLFPEPKLTPTYAGVDRELLMKTNPSFPGIAPKLEFSTRTTITQLPLQSRRWYRERNKIRVRRTSSASPRRRSISPARTRKNKSYRRFSRSLRSPSPDQTKHLLDLSKDDQQQTSPLSLRSTKQKAETTTRPPFVVRHVDTSKMFEQTPLEVTSRNARQNSPLRNSRPFQLKRALSVDSWKASCPTAKVIREPDEHCTCNQDSSPLETRKPINYSSISPTRCHQTSFASPQRYRSPSPRGRWASPAYRFYSSPSSSWEEINERVRNLLTSDEARQRLSNGPTDFEIDDVLERRSISLRSSPLCDSLEERYCS